jgi:large subunit ribosomal protein L6
MSRIGKLPISVPEGVKINFQPAGKSRVEVAVQGPKGELKTKLSEAVKFQVGEKEVKVTLDPKFAKMTAMWGTARSVLANMIKGVTEGYQKQLELQGTGYKVNLQGNKLVLDVGYSKSVEFTAPKGIELAVEKNIITISGLDKQLVGETAARIRKIRKVEPYKGKGLRYVGEIVRRKEGKKAVGEAG